MSNAVCIYGNQLTVKEYSGRRVVTFRDIDRIHQRPEGTARKRFKDNFSHFRMGEDYFALSGEALSEFRTDLPEGEISIYAPNIFLITEPGYLMLVKSLTDDLAWEVQRELVKNYFRVKVAKHKTQLDILREAIDQIEIAQQEAREAKEIAQNIKDAVIHTDEDWRKWVNEQLNRVGHQIKDYREARKWSYDILENRARCRLGIRLDNLKDRLRAAGATQSRLTMANKLDVIEEDPRLKEIYTSVIEKLSIKYSA